MQSLKCAAIVGVVLAGLASPAVAEVVTTECGAVIRSVTKTSATEFFTTSSEQPVKVPGTSTVFTVPPGEERCIRVRFSAVANCPNSCFVKAFINTTQMNPANFSLPSRFSTDNTNGGTAHSFEWILRVGPGRHTTRIEMSRGNSLGQADIGPYTTAIELAE